VVLPGVPKKKDTDQVVIDLERGAMWFFFVRSRWFCFPALLFGFLADKEENQKKR